MESAASGKEEVGILEDSKAVILKEGKDVLKKGPKSPAKSTDSNQDPVLPRGSPKPHYSVLHNTKWLMQPKTVKEAREAQFGSSRSQGENY